MLPYLKMMFVLVRVQYFRRNLARYLLAMNYAKLSNNRHGKFLDPIPQATLSRTQLPPQFMEGFSFSLVVGLGRAVGRKVERWEGR